MYESTTSCTLCVNKNFGYIGLGFGDEWPSVVFWYYAGEDVSSIQH